MRASFQAARRETVAVKRPEAKPPVRAGFARVALIDAMGVAPEDVLQWQRLY
jgi:hypothetical protein